MLFSYSNNKRSKLDEKVEIGILIGYSSSAKAYRIFNPKTKKISMNRDVQVDEFSTWNWERNEVEDDKNMQQ